MTNALREALDAGRFFWTLEFIPSVERVLRDELAKLDGIASVMREDPRLASFAVTDRVVSERDPEPVAAAACLLDATAKQPLVHFSGKGRDIAEVDRLVARMTANALENVLVVTGDRLKSPPEGERARYLESVPAIQALRRQRPDWLIACALNPFKYCEEDGMAQYLKLGKKVGAGANLVITQIGFDPAKYGEALRWVRGRGWPIPLVANVMPLTAPRARYMRQHKLAGITITDSMMALLEAEATTLADKGAARALRRLALQIVGVRRAGYAGVQITAIHEPRRVGALAEAVTDAERDCPDDLAWHEAWGDALRAPDGTRADPVPAGQRWTVGQRTGRAASLRERAAHGALRLAHDVLFHRGPVAAAVGASVAPLADHDGAAMTALTLIERGLKGPLLGCETCGMCRLAATQFICPETCPKGLANGPCGGTTENRCEFGDRECIHSVKYRRAAAAGITRELETLLIPAVPSARRHRSSWPAHFAGRGPQITEIDGAGGSNEAADASPYRTLSTSSR